MKTEKHPRLGWFGLARLSLTIMILLGLVACSSSMQTLRNTNWIQQPAVTQSLVAEVRDYQYSDAVKPNEVARALMNITPEMSDAVHALFNYRTNVPRELAAAKIAKWIIAPDGLNIQYDVDANYGPQEAYAQRRANCLSFTLLLEALAMDMGITLHVNEVDIPVNWGLNEQQSMVFYRHVNAVQSANGRRLVFDLAMDQYRLDYPQRRLTLEHAYAQLMSNQAIDALKVGDTQLAEHMIKLALSTYAEDASLWVNYGVINEHLNNDAKAEMVFRYALTLDPQTVIAASNLARLLNEQQRIDEANVLNEVADWIRRSNPYHHFLTAHQSIESGDLKSAQNHIDAAIRLHSEDARFYAVRSRIALAKKRFKPAYIDMKKAYELAQYANEKKAFRSKALWLASKANLQYQEQSERALRALEAQRLRDSMSRQPYPN